MISIEQFIAAIGALQGFVLFVLLTSDARVTKASRLLGFTCLLIAAIFLSPFLRANIDQVWVRWVFSWLFCLQALSGALGYLYARSVLTDAAWCPRDLVHLVPTAICIVLTADALFLDPSEMAQWMAGTQTDNWRLPATEYVLVAQAIGYSVWTLIFVLRHRRESHANLANFHAGLFTWLITLQVLPLIVILLAAVPGLFSILPALSGVANLVMVIFVYFIALTQWRNPALFIIEQSAGKTSDSAPDEPPRTEGELDAPTRAALFEDVRKTIETRQIFLDSELTLTGLAAATGLSKHHLSEVLNRHAGKNFYEFINTYRVDFVKERLAKGTDEKLLDIALEAGFSSKSTFNAIFKQFTGQTPSQYRKEL